MGLNKVHFKRECLAILFITEDNIVQHRSKGSQWHKVQKHCYNFSSLGDQHCYFLSIRELDLDLKIRNKSCLWRYRILLISVFSIWVNMGIWRCRERQRLDGN